MKRSVLVVDDDPLILRIVSTILDLEEFDVATAQDAAEAMQILDGARPDIVVTDVMMPGMDGFELCRKIKDDHPTMPVILLTAREDDDSLRQGKESGSDAYLTKPFSPLELIDAIESLLAKA